MTDERRSLLIRQDDRLAQAEAALESFEETGILSYRRRATSLAAKVIKDAEQESFYQEDAPPLKVTIANRIIHAALF